MPAVDRIELPDGRSVWMVTKYALAKKVLGDTTLSNDTSRMGGKAPLAALPASVREVMAQDMLNTDPPKHTRLRRLVAQNFTIRSVQEMRPLADGIADRLLSKVDISVEVDLVPEYAQPLPTLVLGALIGIPEEDCPDVQYWSDTFVSELLLISDKLQASAEWLSQYAADLVRRKRLARGDDLLSRLIAADLEDDELSSMVFVLLIAGQTAASQLIAKAVHLLLTHPDQLATLRADDSLLPGMVDEALRFESPLDVTAFRMTTEPFEIDGVTIPTGEIVICSMPAINRDPDRFPDPDTFDIRRVDNAHLSFGFGIHRCLGANLARVEAEAAVAALLRLHSDSGITVREEGVRWQPGGIMHLLTSLPVRFTSPV
ncbi:cytochrome P450 [Amycolatopsis decaplanina]|uniref:Peroxidase n=1 Tax=Amycolatopsis decaplanina DSM 44594 TaxID=1284240 RepID=M2Y0E3_9PSEU|nr:cytochrome P450 [Amycolatopsis decaplanina]EME55000.1 peroxidase [Amycolatopsis decaplanina DSM 44594]